MFWTNLLCPQHSGPPVDLLPHQVCPGSLCSLSSGEPPYPPLPEVPVEDTVGEALPADADALQHTVAAQLVHDQGVVYHPCSRMRWERKVWGECQAKPKILGSDSGSASH